jgi:hypothetical protein
MGSVGSKNFRGDPQIPDSKMVIKTSLRPRESLFSVLLGRILQERKERCCGIVIAILWAWRSLFGFGREDQMRWMGQNQA